MKEFINKHLFKIFDVLFFGLGGYLFLYYLFDISHSSRGLSYYYYRDDALIGIAVGVVLIVLGFLVRSWRSK